MTNNFYDLVDIKSNREKEEIESSPISTPTKKDL